MSQNVPQTTTEQISAQQIAYQQFLSDPFDNRSEQEVAEALGVNRRTLYRWRQQPDFLDQTYSNLLLMVQADLKHVFRGLIRKAQSGDVNAAKLLFEVLGKLRQDNGSVDQHLHLHRHFEAEKVRFGI